MNLNTIAQNIAAVASSISGVRGASPWEVDTIPVTPYAVVGMSRATILPGDRQVTDISIPMRLYVERTADGARDAKGTNTYVNSFITTFALDQSLGATVSDAYITAWDSDVFYAIGGALYAAVDFTLTATVHEHVPQALRTVI